MGSFCETNIADVYYYYIVVGKSAALFMISKVGKSRISLNFALIKICHNVPGSCYGLIGRICSGRQQLLFVSRIEESLNL